METAVEHLPAIKRLLDGGSLPRRERAKAQRIVENLKRPSRIGLFGLPGSGKARMLAALTGHDFTMGGGFAPTIEVNHGQSARTLVTYADGERADHAERLNDIEFIAEPLFVQVFIPDEGLHHRQYLLVAAHDSEADIRGAWRWAEDRIDLPIWCSKSASAREEDLIRLASRRVQDRLVRVLMDSNPEALDGRTSHSEDFLKPDATDPDQIARGIEEIIKEAETQKHYHARLFLHRHTDLQPPLPAQNTDATDQPDGPTPDQPAHPGLTPAQRSGLTRVYHFLRKEAETLRAELELTEPQPQEVKTSLTNLEDLFETLVAKIEAIDDLDISKPDLYQTYEDARDLAVLLRVEGGLPQLVEGVRCLAHLRRETEDCLRSL